MTDFQRVKDAQELIERYSGDHWWFDPDCDIEESMQALLDVVREAEPHRHSHGGGRLDAAFAKLEHGVTDQDIAETMPPEPGR